MAKAKNRKAQGAGADSKTIRIIAGVILLAIILVLSIVFGVAYKRTNGFAEVKYNFYVDVNGKRYYTGGNLQLKKQSITTFKCGYTAGNQSADKLYTVKITSTTTDKTAFTYTLDGAKRKFLGGEDYTDCFDITQNATSFEIAHVNDTPETVLQRRYPGKTVTAPETDPNVSYFLLTVTSSDNTATVTFALTFDDLKMNIDPGGVIF